jgi:hypothetical membrane protein
MIHGLVACGVIGPLLFIAVLTIEGWLRPGYRADRHFVSSLAAGPRGWVQRINFWQCGALAVAFAAGIWLDPSPAPHPGAMPWLLGVFGLGLIAAGSFATDAVVDDADTSYALHAVTPVTTGGTIHNVASLVVFATLSAAACVMAVRFARDGHPIWAAYSALTTVTVVTFFLRGGVLIAKEALGEISNTPFGRYQRLALIPGWAWLAVVALHWLRSA